jgi:threonine 3-dehydrogenase
MKADHVLNPAHDNVYEYVMNATEGTGVDVILEMSGHPDAIRLGFKILRLGGRASLLGIPSKPMELNLANDIIFKGATVQGINGRLMYKTWFQMNAMLKAGKLDLDPVITDRMSMADFSKGMDRLRSGESSKILLYPNGMKG